MIQLSPHIPIPMTPGRDVEISLHLIPLQTPINATRVDSISPPQLGTLGELPPGVPPHLTQYMAHMGVLFLRLQPARILATKRLILVIVVALVRPELPAGGVLLQQLSGENAVTGGVLDVDVQSVAGHLDDDVEVQLEVMGDALFNAEVVVFGAFEPGFKFGDGEDAANEEDKDGPLAASAGGSCVVGFGFGWIMYVSFRSLHLRWASVLFKRRTERIECLQAALQPGLLPERILVEAVRCEAIHDESVWQGADKSIDQGMNEN